MKVKSIKLVNYRSHKNLSLDFSDNINVIYGNNGSGKTNIAESINYISYLKSFRTNSDRELIHFDEDFAKVNLHTTDNFEIIITKSSKKCLYNESVVKKQSDYVGLFKSVLFSPETIELLLKSPSERRKYIDMLLCTLDKEYMFIIKEFYHVLKQRNEYLKQLMISNLADKNFLSVLDDKFIELSCKIYRKRLDMISDLNHYAKEVFSKFFDFEYEIKYEVQKGIDFDNLEDSLREKLNSRYDRELMLGKTITGPSRDDIVFSIDDHNARFFSSKGQQRIALISLKLAEVEIINKVFGTYPVLLLDDVLSELDESRQNYLFEVLSLKKIQTIISTTDVNDIKLKIDYNSINLDKFI